MLIDPISIHFSGKVANTVVSGPEQAKFILAFKDLLTHVGWTVTDQLYATATINIPFGGPTRGLVEIFPKGVVRCPGGAHLQIGGAKFVFYNPMTDIPSTGGTCLWVKSAVTSEESLQNLADKVTGNTDFNATIIPDARYGSNLLLQAKLPGPAFNFIPWGSDYHGFIGLPGATAGGGYRFQSAPGASIYEVILTAPGDALSGVLKFVFVLNGVEAAECTLLDATQGTTTWPFSALGTGDVAQYTIVANPHGFAVFDAPHDPGIGYRRLISLFAMAPYIPGSEVPSTEHFVTPYAVFVVWPNAIGGEPFWGNSTMCLDNPAFNSWGESPVARLLALRSPGLPLLTPHDVPLTIGAYVMFGKSLSSAAWVVGKLWDCALVSDIVDAGAMIGDKQFLTLGYSDGSSNQTRCTLMMACGETVIPTPPPGPPLPVPPTPDPPPPATIALMSGTVNLFGDGVSWLSGDLFVPEMSGRSITIAGEPYIILSVTDSHNLTLTTAKVIAPGATYTSP